MGHDLTELDNELLPVAAWVQPANLASRPRRRRRKMFAAAEPLEARTMLSAVSVAFEGAGAVGFGIPLSEVAPVTAEVSSAMFGGSDADSSDTENADPRAGELAPTQKSAGLGDLNFDAPFDFGLEASFGGGLWGGFALAASGTASSPSAAQRVSSGFDFNSDSEGESESSDLADGGNLVELKLAGSGQIVAYGAARSLQDDSGLTVGDSDGPTTYVRATDAEGRSVMRLVFVQKGPRVVTPARPQQVIAESVIVAEAELDSNAALAESSERAELNEVATALDAPHPEKMNRGSRSHESTLMANLAETDRVGSRTSSIDSTAKGSATRSATTSYANHSANPRGSEAGHNQNASIEATENDDQVIAAFETSELAATVFHPQPKYLILAMLIIGTLTRPFSRVGRSFLVRRLRGLGAK